MLASLLHWVWVNATCRMDYSYRFGPGEGSSLDMTDSLIATWIGHTYLGGSDTHLKWVRITYIRVNYPV